MVSKWAPRLTVTLDFGVVENLGGVAVFAVHVTLHVMSRALFTGLFCLGRIPRVRARAGGWVKYRGMRGMGTMYYHEPRLITDEP
jgi:hypothetical protein